MSYFKTNKELIEWLIFIKDYVKEKFKPNICRCNDCACIENGILAIEEAIKKLKEK